MSIRTIDYKENGHPYYIYILIFVFIIVIYDVSCGSNRKTVEFDLDTAKTIYDVGRTDIVDIYKFVDRLHKENRPPTDVEAAKYRERGVVLLKLEEFVLKNVIINEGEKVNWANVFVNVLAIVSKIEDFSNAIEGEQ